VGKFAGPARNARRAVVETLSGLRESIVRASAPGAGERGRLLGREIVPFTGGSPRRRGAIYFYPTALEGVSSSMGVILGNAPLYVSVADRYAGVRMRVSEKNPSRQLGELRAAPELVVFITCRGVWY
jgi:hypothetical protein